MSSKVTIQDIADALGVSRNTVSKAINNTGVLAASTRDKVLQKAQEMGYKQFSYLNISEAAKLSSASDANISEKHEIALFLGNFVGNSHFASTMLDKFQRELAQLGYSLAMYRVTAEEIEGLKLPDAFAKDRTAGIACIEIFDHAYSDPADRLARQRFRQSPRSRPSVYGQLHGNLPFYQGHGGAREKTDRLYRQIYALPVLLRAVYELPERHVYPGDSLPGRILPHGT